MMAEEKTSLRYNVFGGTVGAPYAGQFYFSPEPRGAV
jgi:hypothetical protein